MAAFFDSRVSRRLVLVPLTLLTTALLTVFVLPLAAVAVVADVVTLQRRLPRLRVLLLVVGGFWIETIGLVGTLAAWVLTGFGLIGPQRWRWRFYRPFMGWYTNTVLALIVRVLGTRVEWRDHADLSQGPVVLLARHTSFFDALIPATVLSHRNRLLSHHIVTHGLRYAPCIDIVGHRLPTRFIKRDPGEGSNELVHITEVGTHLDRTSAAIIFPEGTFRSPSRFERVLRRIRRRDPELAERAASLDHVLPPRANGTHALLAGAPDADVVICTNTGFEPFGSIKAILDHPFTRDPIIVETWRIPRHEIPSDLDAFNAWLFDRFVEIDHWVKRTRATS